MLQLLLLTVFITLASAGNVTFTDCANKELTSVDVSGCSGATCSVKIGSSVTITSTFVANQDSNKATMAEQATLGELKVALPLDDTDGCKVITPMCPLKKGQTYSIKLTQTVDHLQAGTHPVITGTLIGDSGVLYCGSVPLTVA
jgi:hypothetical protein